MTKPVKIPVWNNLDSIGLLNGLSIWDHNYMKMLYVRLPGESNIDLRNRIIKNHNNPVEGTSIQDTINGISNELFLESYNTNNKTFFNLTYTPYPVGSSGEQDIWVYYQLDGSSDWVEFGPQLWSETYDASSQGFIVWQESRYNDNNSTKEFTYSTLLFILSDTIPDNTKLKVKYYVKKLANDGSSEIVLFTDMNPSLLYRRAYEISLNDLNSKVVVYDLNHIPSSINDRYFDSDGKATDQLYQLRDIIDSTSRFRWSDIYNKSCIWDVHRNFSKGVVPSFYDQPISVPDDFNGDVFSGGIEKGSYSLAFKDIKIVNDNGIERWYPEVYKGIFYTDGVPFNLLGDAGNATIDIIDNVCSLIGIINDNDVYKRFYLYPTINNDASFEEHNYAVESTVFRYRPNITADMGYDLVLDPDEFTIDFDSKQVITNGINGQYYLIWDTMINDTVVLADPTIDMNPVNNSFKSSYFITYRNNAGVIN